MVPAVVISFDGLHIEAAAVTALVHEYGAHRAAGRKQPWATARSDRAKHDTLNKTRWSIGDAW